MARLLIDLTAFAFRRFAHPDPPKGDSPNKSKQGPLPQSLDWRTIENGKYITPVMNQGACGSCYAVSTATIELYTNFCLFSMPMHAHTHVPHVSRPITTCVSHFRLFTQVATADVATMRLRIQTQGRDNTTLSAQSVVSCSSTNQVLHNLFDALSD